MRSLAAIFILALAACGGEPAAADPAESIQEEVPVEEAPPAPPTLDDAARNSISAYASGTIISCGTVVAKYKIRQLGGSADGEDPEPEPADRLQSMHAELEGFPTAQQALKELRSAETECLRTAAPGMDQRVRSASIALRTELEMIPGP